MQATSVDPGPGKRRAFYTPELLAQTNGRNERRACARCGKVRKSKAATCRECYHAIRQEVCRVQFACQQCGKVTTMIRAEVGKSGRPRKFCSPECFAASIRRGGKPCKVCGKPTGSNDRRRFYCSRECKATTRPAKREKGCPQCGLVFAYSSSRRIYCTKACADVAHAQRMIGRGNSRYKDGTSYADWFRKMRPLIRLRDHDECRVCGATERILEVKHGTTTQRKTSFTVHHLNEIPQDNRPENLILLCGACHAIHHKSERTPFAWFADYTLATTIAMDPDWHRAVAELQARYGAAGLQDAREAERERVGSGSAPV